MKIEENDLRLSLDHLAKKMDGEHLLYMFLCLLNAFCVENNIFKRGSLDFLPNEELLIFLESWEYKLSDEEIKMINRHHCCAIVNEETEAMHVISTDSFQVRHALRVLFKEAKSLMNIKNKEAD